MTQAALMEGMNQRNLVTLEAFDRLRRVLDGGAVEAAAPRLAGRGTWSDPYVIDAAALPFGDAGDSARSMTSEVGRYACGAQDEEIGLVLAGSVEDSDEAVVDGDVEREGSSAGAGEVRGEARPGLLRVADHGSADALLERGEGRLDLNDDGGIDDVDRGEPGPGPPGDAGGFPKLVYPDGMVQHAGVILGIGGVAAHVHKFISADAPGYCGRARIVQDLLL